MRGPLRLGHHHQHAVSPGHHPGLDRADHTDVLGRCVGQPGHELLPARTDSDAAHCGGAERVYLRETADELHPDDVERRDDHEYEGCEHDEQLELRPRSVLYDISVLLKAAVAQPCYFVSTCISNVRNVSFVSRTC